MIDIHCHILPGVDDGSTSVEESVQLLEMLQKQGVHTLAATPHFYAVEDSPEQFLQRRKDAFDRLASAGVDTGNILPGAEVAYYDGMGKSQVMEQLQIGISGLLLVEMPFRAWSERMIDEICNIPQLGLQPILAHIDRYNRRNQLRKYKDKLLDNGVYFQCNATAFLKGWKSRPYFQMLQRGEIHFLGSDCHNLTTRAPKMELAAAAIEKKLGADVLPALNETAKELLFPKNREN